MRYIVAMATTTRYQDQSEVRTGASPRETPKRTHQIGVRVTDDELRRLELRASIAPNRPRPLATYLRLRGLDAEPRREPTPELLEALGRVADQLAGCYANPYNDKATRRAIEAATETFRELVAKVG